MNNLNCIAFLLIDMMIYSMMSYITNIKKNQFKILLNWHNVFHPFFTLLYFRFFKHKLENILYIIYVSTFFI